MKSFTPSHRANFKGLRAKRPSPRLHQPSPHAAQRRRDRPVASIEVSWDRVNDVNLKSHVPDLRACAPAYGAAGQGRHRQHRLRLGQMLAWSSLNLLCSDEGRGHSVHPVIALQYARSGIRANSILPGMMNTPMVHAPEVIAAYGGSGRRRFRRRDEQCPIGGWAMPGMSPTRLCSRHPTRPNTLRVPS
jgi:NAD(P)-dependent dehydrogenase (short-subunit alcohol dehydrogenase family)